MSNKIIANNCYFDPETGTFNASSNDNVFGDFMKKNRKILKNLENDVDSCSIKFITHNTEFLNEGVTSGLYTCSIEFDFQKKIIIVELISKNEEHEKEIVLKSHVKKVAWKLVTDYQ